ncbi:MAG: type II toxin-antitoxin system HipA family toxin [Gemmatimonadota bacterium]
MTEYTTTKVGLWGHEVGYLAESETGEIVFEYAEDFRKSGLEISPINLPLSVAGPQTFPELRRSASFSGLPGVFSDSLPDAFGNKVIERYFSEQGGRSRISPVQKLLYVGDRGSGALVYEPATTASPGTTEVLEVRDLVDQARRVIEGDTTGVVRDIMRIGATAGGARAKALILWDQKRNTVRSGHVEARPGETPWIIKFDGVTRESGGQANVASPKPGPWGRIEYVYSVLARRAGIAMPDTHLLREGPRAHFMVKRFDRRGARGTQRVHMHSLGGMLHLDYNDQYQIGYEVYFDLMRELGLGQHQVDEAFRRMVFSVATVNYDDHLKNFSFLMDEMGRWRLSPAYDVAFAENEDWTRQHQMSIAGKFKGITRADLIEVGEKFDVPRGGAIIIDEVLDSVLLFGIEASEAGVGPELIQWFEERLGDETKPLQR